MGRAGAGPIRRASCWEDADLLCTALRPAPGRRLLAVASAGDNALALLADGAEVVAADPDPAQLACLELRRAAFARLEHDELLAFLGARDGVRRGAVYRALRGELPAPAAAFWDARPALVAAGALRAGRLERAMEAVRRRWLRVVHGPGAVRALLAERDAEARERFYVERWNNLRWQLLFRWVAARWLARREVDDGPPRPAQREDPAGAGRDAAATGAVRDAGPAGAVRGDVRARAATERRARVEALLLRARHLLTVVPTHDNPYLHRMLTGAYGDTLPRWLRPELHDAIRDGLERLRVVHAPLERAAGVGGTRAFDGCDLSDALSRGDPAARLRACAALVQAARPGARLAHRCLPGPPPALPSDAAPRVRRLHELERELAQQDRTPLAGAVVVEEVG